MPLTKRYLLCFSLKKGEKEMKRDVKVLKINDKTDTKLSESELEDLILKIFDNIKMPIRKSMLIKIIDIFELKNTKKQFDFAVTGLLEEHNLIQKKHFLYTQELADQGRSCPTQTEENIIKYLASNSLKETIKQVFHFNSLSNRKISANDYFKYIRLECPFASNDALSYLEYLDRKVYNLKDSLYREMNDYPYTDGFLTKFLSDRDTRLLIRDIKEHKKSIIIKVVLLPGKGNYRLAHEKLKLLEENLPNYFKDDKKVIIKSVPLAMAL